MLLILSILVEVLSACCMKSCRLFIVAVFVLLSVSGTLASGLLIPMDDAQKNHLKAYGLTFAVLQRGGYSDWLLNYRGGSFLLPYEKFVHTECMIRGITFEVLSDVQINTVLKEI